MPSPATTTLLSFLALGASVVAQINVQDSNASDCPGVFFINSVPATSACCVGGSQAPPVVSVCKGWPICKGPTTTTPSPTPLSCATVITKSVSGGSSNEDYTSMCNAAKDSLSAHGTHIRTTLGSGGGSQPASAAPSASAGASSTGSSGASSSSSSGSGSPASKQNESGKLALQLGLLGISVLAFAAFL